MRAAPRLQLLSAALFLLFAQAAAWGQAETGSKQVSRIPRRVFFSYAPSAEQAPEGRARVPFDESAVEVLYSYTASLQPIIRVETPARAHNVCRIEVDTSSPAGGEEKKAVVTVSLYERSDQGVEEEPVYRSRLEYGGRMHAYTEFLEKTAGEMASKLDLVEPQIRLTSRVENQQEREMVEELSFAQQLNRPLALRGRLGNLTMDFTSFDSINTGPQILPFFADALWFPSKNHGMLFSLMTDVRDSDSDSDTEMLLFPGVGYSYRTLGRVAAGFDFALYGGRVFGLEEISFYTLMSISPSVSYNFTPSLGMTCKLASLYFSWDAFFGRKYGDTRRNVMFQQILGLGLVYRPGK